MNARYPDPFDREAFESHALSVVPAEMTVRAIRKELDFLFEAAVAIGDPKLVGTLDWGLLVLGLAGTLAGIVFIPAVVIGLGLLFFEYWKLTVSGRLKRAKKSALARVRRRRSALGAELERRGY